MYKAQDIWVANVSFLDVQDLFLHMYKGENKKTNATFHFRFPFCLG